MQKLSSQNHNCAAVPPEPYESGSGFRLLAGTAAFAALLCFASALTITPASLNEIAKEYSLGPSRLGVLFFVSMVGFLSAIVAAGHFSDKRGKLPFILFGCILVGAGMGWFGLSRSYTEALAASALMGVGGGFGECTAMALVGDLFTGRLRTGMLNWSQAAFGLGAVAAPVVIAALLRTGSDWRRGFFYMMAAAVVAGILTALALSMRREKPVGAGTTDSGWRGVVSDRLVVWCSLGILLYVGAECGTGHWLAKYFELDLHSSAPLAASSPAFFWAGVTAGRAGAAWASKHVGEVVLLRWTLGLAGLSHVTLLLAGSHVFGLPATVIVGFFLGPVFPTTVSFAGAAHPSRSGAVVAVIFFAGAIGGTIFPPLVGAVAEFTGLRPALSMCLVALAADLAIFLKIKANPSAENAA